MKFVKILFLSALLFNFFNIASAHYSDDPYEPDTVYLKASSVHSSDGCTLYVPTEFPADVALDVWVKLDEQVYGVSLPLVDTCYDPVIMPTYLDPMKNDPGLVEPNCFTGTVLEDFSIKALNLYGVDPTPTPPNFLLGAVHFTDHFGVFGIMQSYKLAHLIFTVNDTGLICLDTIPEFQPGGANPSLACPWGGLWAPTFKLKCFQIKIGPPQRGDVDADGIISLGDPIYLAKYYLKGGPAPYFPGTGDVDCSGLTNLEDVIYLANYILKGGPPPCPMD